MNIDEIGLTNLNLQVETLVHSRKQLLTENHSLRKRLAKLVQERATLLNSRAKISKRVKTIIEQIRKETS